MIAEKRFPDHRSRLEAFRRCDVYPVITGGFCGGRDVLQVTRQVLEGGARIVQIREKSMPDRAFLELLRAARQLTWEYGALLIADDRLDAALAAEADGVHLGQEDLPVADARRLAPELLLGVSTHNAGEIRRAQAEGCSYLNAGPVFATQTKQLACDFLGLQTLTALIPEIHVPFSVMGGIKEEHLPGLLRLGVRHVAAVTAFTMAADPASEIRRWRNYWQSL